MKKNINNQLLPEGFKVLLPEEAHKEELISRKILDILINNEYSLVKTPLIEYEPISLSNKNFSLDNIEHQPFF